MKRTICSARGGASSMGVCVRFKSMIFIKFGVGSVYKFFFCRTRLCFWEKRLSDTYIYLVVLYSVLSIFLKLFGWNLAYHVTSGMFQLCDTRYIGNHTFQNGVKDIVPILSTLFLRYG